MGKCGKNVVELDRPQLTIWRMRITCWIPKATNTHSEYVIRYAFPLQRCMHKRASLTILFDSVFFQSLIPIEPFKHGVPCDVPSLWTLKPLYFAQKACSPALCDSHKKQRLYYYWRIFHFVIRTSDSQCHVRTKFLYIGQFQRILSKQT
jgi:hypothetical protein